MDASTFHSREILLAWIENRLGRTEEALLKHAVYAQNPGLTYVTLKNDKDRIQKIVKPTMSDLETLHRASFFNDVRDFASKDTRVVNIAPETMRFVDEFLTRMPARETLLDVPGSNDIPAAYVRRFESFAKLTEKWAIAKRAILHDRTIAREVRNADAGFHSEQAAVHRRNVAYEHALSEHIIKIVNVIAGEIMHRAKEHFEPYSEIIPLLQEKTAYEETRRIVSNLTDEGIAAMAQQLKSNPDMTATTLEEIAQSMVTHYGFNNINVGYKGLTVTR